MTSFGYDPATGWLASVLDPEGQSWGLTPDAVGRVVASTRPDGWATGVSYDEESNVIGVTPPGSFEHAFGYDGDGMTTSYAAPDPETGTPAEQVFGYAYDDDGRPVRVDLPGGGAVTFEYAADTHRLSRVSWPHDGAPATTEVLYDAPGRVVGLADTDAVGLAFVWDGALPLSTTWSGSVSGTVALDYDSAMRVSEIDVAGIPVALTYDDDDRLVSAGELAIIPNETTGLLAGTALGWVSDTFTPDGFGALDEHRAYFAGTELYRESYEHDDLGRIRRLTESVDGEPAEVRTYTYDGAQRLALVADGAGVVLESFTYDPNGNRDEYDTLIPGETCAAEYDEQDRLESCAVAGGASVSWTWDDLGSLGSFTDHTGETTLYAYDVHGGLRAVELPSGDTIEYTIDAAGRRVGRSVNGAFDRGWLYLDALNPVAEVDATGAVRSVFVYGTRPHVPDHLLRREAGEWVEHRLVTDVRGSVRLVVRASDGAVAQRLDYDAWGRVLADTNPGFQPFGYAGGLYDPATTLVRFGARDYDARVGRWTARDPILFAGGQGNLYAYVDGDPVNHIDPEGRYIERVERHGPPPHFKRHAHGWTGRRSGRGLRWSINEDGTAHDGNYTRIPWQDAEVLRNAYCFYIPPDNWPALFPVSSPFRQWEMGLRRWFRFLVRDDHENECESP